MNDTGNRVIAGVVIVLLVIGAWYLGTTFKPATGTKVTMATSTSGTNIGSSTNASTNTTGTTPAGATLTVSGGAVSVKDQPAGSSVLVSSVTLAQLGWVAVRDSSGRTLGAALFGAGTYSAVQVPLLRNTVSGEHYQVLLYADDGDKVFDLHKDTLVMNADGTVAGTTFTAN